MVEMSEVMCLNDTLETTVTMSDTIGTSTIIIIIIVCRYNYILSGKTGSGFHLSALFCAPSVARSMFYCLANVHLLKSPHGTLYITLAHWLSGVWSFTFTSICLRAQCG